MRVITKRRINKTADEIIDAVLDHTDFEVEVTGHQDYDIQLFINKRDKLPVTNLIYEILTDKKPRKHWKLINIAVRKVK